ncbi:hypothetical protein OX284_012405 [Flavobacterium sp. SUN046]|uniref:hypothetical protein n=1 Tax=Flavobacterium sp. SUN046 TaxID=3002440 RepID=UPI002DBC0D34|nr:hypothetical protein [Flavobacterium sp. SUN046]MEC4050236.1 hypothetical protein [Flavobacterium sp. SUN046]
MLKVAKIVTVKPFEVRCLFNNGIEKTIDVLPLIENDKHLKGIENLKNESVFNKVKIGQFGELYWEKLIKNNTTEDL